MFLSRLGSAKWTCLDGVTRLYAPAHATHPLHGPAPSWANRPSLESSMPPKKPAAKKTVEALKHDEATRKNIPTAEYQSVLQKNEQEPVKVSYPSEPRPRPPARLARQRRAGLERPRRQRPAPLHPGEGPPQGPDRRPPQPHQGRRPGFRSPARPDLFGDFNGMPKGADKTEFYQHDQNWSNRMILGDSLAGDGLPRRARGPARQGPVHLLRPALRHQVQQQLPVEHHQPRREGRQHRLTSRASPSRSKPSATPGATASTAISPTCATA